MSSFDSLKSGFGFKGIGFGVWGFYWPVSVKEIMLEAYSYIWSYKFSITN